MLDRGLEKYKIVYQAYESEIKNLWQRSIFLGAFMILVWGGYGALQLKFIEKCLIKKAACVCLDIYCLASIGLCVILVILSWLWIAMAKGSKFIQEAHEDKIKQGGYSCLFCTLGDYETAKYPNRKDKIFAFICPFSAFRFSVSKINIALGWVSLLVAFGLLMLHIKFNAICLNKIINNDIMLFIMDNIVICILIVLPLLIYLFLKGGNTLISFIVKCLLGVICIQMFIDKAKEIV